MYSKFSIQIATFAKSTRFSAQAETPQAEPGQKSAYKENNDKAINNGKLNRIKGEPHT